MCQVGNKRTDTGVRRAAATARSYDFKCRVRESCLQVRYGVAAAPWKDGLVDQSIAPYLLTCDDRVPLAAGHLLVLSIHVPRYVGKSKVGFVRAVAARLLW